MLALIPARGGSKGLPGKNILPVGGIPMLGRVAKAASASSRIDRVVVTTDSREIAEVARQYGAEVPFLRAPELAGDTVPVAAAVIDAVERLAEIEGRTRSAVAILQANSPFLSTGDIDGAIDLFEEAGASAVLSISPLEKPIEAVFSLEGGRMRNVLRNSYDVNPVLTRRQAHGSRYLINGAIVIVVPDRLRQDSNYFYSDPDVFGFVMPPERSLDIDTPAELRMAEALARSEPDTQS